MKHSPQLKADQFAFEAFFIEFEDGDAKRFEALTETKAMAPCLEYLMGTDERDNVRLVSYRSVEGQALDVSQVFALGWFKSIKDEVDLDDIPEFIKRNLPDLDERIDEIRQELDESKSHAEDLAWPR